MSKENEQLSTIAPFNPAILKGNSRFTVTEWQPGQRVRIYSNKVTGGSIQWLIIALAFIACGSLVAIPIYLFYPIIGVIVFLAISTFITYKAVKLEKEREVIVDWPDKTIKISIKYRVGAAARVVSFDQIRKVELKGTRMRMSNSGINVFCYWSTMRLKLDSGEELLLESDQYRDNRDAPQQLLMPMAVELARALSVEYQWVDYQT